MDGLEAHYALLREVSARGHVVQTRLRTSLPLLWTDSALVMNGAARSGNNQDVRRRSRRLGSSNALARKDTDAMGVGDIERLLGEWSSASRRRRLEWEVSRRIARVDRELQMKPRGRRYWHKAPEVSVPETRNVMRTMESIPRVKRISNAVQTEVGMLRSRRSPQGKSTNSSAANMAASDGHYMLSTASWKVNTRASDAADPPLIKHGGRKTKQSRAVDDELDGLEDLLGEARKAAKQPPSPPSRAVSESIRLIDQLADERSDQRGISSSPPASPPLAGESADETSFAVKSIAGELSSDVLLQPARDPAIGAHKSESALDNELSSPHGTKEIKEDSAVGATAAHPSSTGRQVLSDYRTMPSVASFGPGPGVSGRNASSGRRSGRADATPNADILRRLFNDLDSDRDGHINRIETCLALHRLQIAVPATKIASFFRNVYSSSSGSGKSSYSPLHEVINYKQFVAFVTAAFDQQKQAAEAEVAARRARTERVELAMKKVNATAADSQRLFPSTAVPMLQKRSSASANMVMNPTKAPQRETLRYEVEDVEAGVTDSVELTNRIVSEIPDFLVGRVLTDAAREVQEGTNLGRSDAKALVRKSLEGLPRAVDPIEDDKVITQIVQELIKEHLRANLGGDFEGDSSEDLTGLMRAAAFFERQSQMNDTAGYAIEEAYSEQSLSDWLELVTEEQVSALIHEVWRENENSNAVNASAVAEDDPGDGDDEVVELADNATATSAQNLATSPDRVVMIAEKGIQTGEEDGGLHEPDWSNLRPDSQTNDARSVRTHLGRLVLAAVHEDQAPVATVSDALRQLRRLRLDQQAQRRRGLPSRRRHSVVSNEQREIVDVERQDGDTRASCTSSASVDVKSSRDFFEGSIRDDKENYSPPNVAEEALDDHGASEKAAPITMDNEMHASEAQTLGEKRLRTFDLPMRESWSSSDARSSSSSSNNAINSGPSSSVEGSHIFNAVDRQVGRINARRQQTRVQTRNCWSNADLSEGEVDPNDPGNISEGEITGRRREKYATVINSERRRLLQHPTRHQSSLEGLYSSAESGELHTHIISSSSSSRESGELTKVQPILSQRHARRAT